MISLSRERGKTTQENIRPQQGWRYGNAGKPSYELYDHSFMEKAPDGDTEPKVLLIPGFKAYTHLGAFTTSDIIGSRLVTSLRPV